MAKTETRWRILRGSVRWMLSVVSAIRDLDRLREITSVLVRHGFGEVVARAGFGRRASSDPAPAPAAAPEISSTELAKGEDEKKRISTAERVRLVLQDLGPSFIKLGQIASTRTDLLPAEVIAELKKLQDSVPSVPFSDIKANVEASLGAPLEEVFESFEEAPLATASIGQVHRATLQTEDGPRAVVVKVQRGNVGAVIQRDLELLHVMAAAVERALPEARVYTPVALVAQFDRSITAELDFSIEAENAERFAKNFEGSREAAFARFPRVYRKASSKRVLTLEFFDGVKIDRAVAAGVNGKDLVKRAVGVIAKMAFEDGFFHADPHPGNILVLGREDPVLGIIDLGMVGRLTPDMRDRIVDLLVAAARKDAVAVADALYAVGRPTKKVDMREYRAHVASLAEKYLGKPLKEIELGAMIRDLAQGAMKYEIEVPAELMLVGKALMTLESIGKELDPDLDLVAEAQP